GHHESAAAGRARAFPQERLHGHPLGNTRRRAHAGGEDEGMTAAIASRARTRAGLGGTLLLLCLLAGCSAPDPKRMQGYVEGEYVYVASPLAGTLETLSVRRGDQVSAGTPLFTRDAAPEKAARDEAERKLAMHRANWEDAKKGKRPSEIESLA